MILRQVVASCAAALSVAFGATAVFPQALPTASAFGEVLIHQGAGWLTPRATICSLTLVEPGYAYTAQHCNEGDLRVGDPVRSYGGRVLGYVVAAAPPEHYVDAVKIKFLDDVIPMGSYQTRLASSLQPGETLYTSAAISRQRVGQSFGPFAYDWPGTPEIDPVMLITPDITTEGDSGGAVYDAQGRVVGIIRGGLEVRGVVYTAYTPMEEINWIG